MVAWRYESSLLMLMNISTLEDKFRISARPWNILHDSYQGPQTWWLGHRMPNIIFLYFFFLKIILPFATYGLILWGSCGKTHFDELEDPRMYR